MFSIQLARTSDGRALQLLSAEVVRPGFRHKLSFNRDNTIHEVLEPELAAFVQTTLEEAIDTGPRILAQPDLTLALPGLMLGRLRVIIGGPIGSNRQATLRFRYFIGGIQNAFTARTYFDRPALEHREEIGLRALEDVAVPLLNMAMTAQSWGTMPMDPATGPNMTTALASIEAHAVELEFYAGLLRRYIHECGPQRQAELGGFEDPVMRMMQMAEPPVPALRKRSEG
ncbi:MULTISPECIES: hypothetical protein [Jannaschia]|nr:MULTISPECIES: hypothetical protein [unclassified Jannaschia]